MEEPGLPDDIVLQILFRTSTDVAVLLRCAAACKRWRALIADTSFLCRCSTKNACHPLSFLGFFVQKLGASPPVFVPGPSGSLLGICGRPLTSFVTNTPASLLYGAEPLVARRGLLLVRLARSFGQDSIHLAVCNPLTGKCDVLPPLLECYAFAITCAILTNADRCSSEISGPPLADYSTFFMVLAVVASYGGDGIEYFNLYTFSSKEPSRWSGPTNCFTPRIRRRFRVLSGNRKAVVCRGVAHWLVTGFPEHEYLSGYYTFNVSAETGHVASLTGLSIPATQLAGETYGGPTLSIFNGMLALFCLRREGLRLDVWVRIDNRDSEACCK